MSGCVIFGLRSKDVYSNLTGKLLAALTAIVALERFEFLLKTDDDSFVRLPELVGVLQGIGHPRLYWGFLDGRAHVKGRGKWTENEWVLCDRLKHLLDFLITVVPTLLCFTTFSDRILSVLLVQGLISISLLLFCLCEYAYLYREKPALRDVLEERVDDHRPYFITYSRAYVLIATSIAILAVDFPSFPRRFAKTESYGYGLMDVGVGSIVLLNAVLGPEISRGKQRISREILKCFPLVAMGLARLAIVKLSGYHQVISEYGIHWNFFFTLAVVKIISSLMSSLVSMRSFSGLLSCLTGLAYQVLLSNFGLKNVILPPSVLVSDFNNEREGVLDANREGLISVMGYLALYFAGLQLGTFLKKRRGRLKDWFYLLGECLILTGFFGCLLAACVMFLEPPSRRMANVTYIIWIVRGGS